MRFFSIRGYAEQRIISYKDDHNQYQIFEMSNDAALLAKILHKQGFCKDSFLDDSYQKRYILAGINKNNQGNVINIAETDSGIRVGKTSFIIEDSDESNINCRYMIQWGCENIDKTMFITEKKNKVLWVFPPNSKLPVENSCLIKENCCAMLDVSTLRHAGIRINHGASWELAITDLIKNLTDDPRLENFLNACGILITFAEDAVVFIRFKTEDGARKIGLATLALSHGNPEGYLSNQYKRNPDYAFVVMVAAAVMEFDVIMGENQRRKEPDTQSIIRPAKNLMKNGYSIDNLRNYNLFDSTFNSTDPESIFYIPSDNLYEWKVVEEHLRGFPIVSKAMEYVREAKGEIRSLPRFQMGELITHDKIEVEAFHDLSKLIDSYINTPSTFPQSIAVFGTVSSGRSFSIWQIVKRSYHTDNIENLEFNVHEFTSVNDLYIAFHQIREVKLECKIPIVFFNGFDRDQGEWLRYFIEPMKMGAFSDERGRHKIGQCILVFAGTDHHSTAELCALDQGIDFISYLKCSANISGLNRRDPEDMSFILKRAIILRSLCDHYDCTIDDSVSWAMLRRATKYIRGIQSMRSIIEISLTEKKVIHLSSLPSTSQLCLFVEDAFDFIKQVNLYTIFESLCDEISSRIRESFVKLQNTEEYPADYSWDELPDGDKDANRATTLDIPSKLDFLGYEFGLLDSSRESINEFTTEELNKLQMAEHER
ncbi:hypothetical protein FACS18948_6330 [Clostridia bacterium]|nr:hypothetical protein FACS18948_6330 [Clostridia bacterium]